MKTQFNRQKQEIWFDLFGSQFHLLSIWIIWNTVICNTIFLGHIRSAISEALWRWAINRSCPQCTHQCQMKQDEQSACCHTCTPYCLLLSSKTLPLTQELCLVLCLIQPLLPLREDTGSGPDMPYLLNMKIHWQSHNVEKNMTFTEYICYFSI